ncbi:hypothetical protein MRB53_013270 [Persea americana]|uniref:Uncharacterized protein n=1 Tax=Persea americana TaxID=3435 RepID=A0ACC2K803_PERAE|nr:hypothetical protein MRB53_013270 [Persea americana]
MGQAKCKMGWGFGARRAGERERGEEKEIEQVERVLARLREVAVRLAETRRRKVRIRVMDWWQKVIFPMRKAWMAVSARVRARKNGGGILKLHDDVRTCGYEDVQVMWEMLRRYETSELPHPPKRKRPFWRIFVWSSNAPSLSRT